MQQSSRIHCSHVRHVIILRVVVRRWFLPLLLLFPVHTNDTSMVSFGEFRSQLPRVKGEGRSFLQKSKRPDSEEHHGISLA
jgi:hypothetical protein